MGKPGSLTYPTPPVKLCGFGLIRRSRGQALIEYLLMTLMLLFIFTSLYRMLQGQMKNLFTHAGVAILSTYY
jgi:hypothetical protein